jgi:phage-related protein
VDKSKILPARFFETESSGRTPVREWLLELPPEDRKIVGYEIQVAEFGWPVGMPLCRSIKGPQGTVGNPSKPVWWRIARVFFCAHEGNMVLLHGFIKKSQKTPDHEMAVAIKRMKGLKP